MGSKQPDITISIKEIKFLSYETTSRVQEIIKQLPADVYEFQLETQWTLLEKEKSLVIQLSVTLYEKQSNETKLELAWMRLRATFAIVNFEEVIKKENGKVSAPEQLLAIAIGITVSSARGVFVMNVKDTILGNALIPVIDPQTFLPKRTM